MPDTATKASDGIVDGIAASAKVRGAGSATPRAGGSLLSRQRLRMVQLVAYRAYADLRLEAERYYIGFLWWILEPLLEMGVYYVVFVPLVGQRTPDYVAFLLCGLVVWRWFSITVQTGSTSIIDGQGLSMQVAVSQVVFPLTTAAFNSVKFVIVLLVFVPLLALAGTPITVHHLAIPLLFAVTCLFTTGATVLAAAVVPRFASSEVVLTMALRAGLFVSGVFLPVPNDGSVFARLLWFNPVLRIVESWRDVLMHSRNPDWGVLAAVAATGLLLLATGVAIARRFQQEYPRMRR